VPRGLDSLDMNSPLKDQVAQTASWIRTLREEIAHVIVGQEQLVDRLLVGLLANGHVLLEGVPGLAKTLSVRTLATAVQAKFNRIQFTPDLLPADIVGTLIYSPQDGKYHATRGPISRILSSQTKSIVPRPKSRALCWRPCRSARSRSAGKR
jgi:MoxR-like ATPase